MAKKHFQVIIVLLLGVVAGFLGGYLFKQSSKLKEVRKNEIVKKEEKKVNSTAYAKIEEKGKIFEKKIVTGISKSEKKLAIEEQKEEPSHLDTLKKWLEEYVITPYFVEDLVGFILNSYYPVHSKHNLGNEPLLNISLKTLNARYGLELIGFKMEGYSVEKAREKILNTILDPHLLKKQYEHYSDIFINTLIEEAYKTTKEFIVNGKVVERELNKKEVSELLDALAKYVEDLSSVLKIISRDRSLLDRLREFLKAEETTMHNNYLLNQLINEYRVNKLKAMDSQNSTLKAKLVELGIQRKKALKDYELSLKRREQLRTSIIEDILKENPAIKFTTGEVLYICEWVYRRINQGKSLEDIEQLAIIFDLISEKLKLKSEELL